MKARSTSWAPPSAHLLGARPAGAVVRPRKYRSIILSVCAFVLVTELCERLAYYGLTGSLPIFFHKELGFQKDFATELSSLFSSFNYITPLVGAYLADARWGRYKTILVFCVVYVAGMATCVASSYPAFLLAQGGDVGTVRMTFLLGLFGGVAVGSGGIKPNVVTLGADQFDTRDPSQNAEKDRFFNYFYWSINIGATFSYGYLTSLAINGEPSIGIPKQYGFFASFAIPGVSMLLAVVVFFSGSSRFHRVPASGSAFSTFLRVFCTAGKRTRTGRIILVAIASVFGGMLLTIAGFLLRGQVREVCAITGMAGILLGLMLLIAVAGDASWISEGVSSAELLRGGESADGTSYGAVKVARNHHHSDDGAAQERARARSTSSQLMGHADAKTMTDAITFSSKDVHDAKQVARLLPYLSLITMFWACYGQMNNNFVIQGCQMDLRVWFGGHQMSSAFLALFDSLVIMIFIPIFDVIVYPLIAACRGGKQLTVMQRIGSGFIFCALSMGVAGLVEVWRKASPVIPVSPQCATNASFDASCLDNSGCAPVGQIQEMHVISVWWESIQYTLIGVGEILTSISSYELFYSQVPESMRSVCQGLNLLTTSVGFMITGGVNSVFSFWIPNNLDHGHLEYVYWAVSGMVLINFVAFVNCSQTFEYSRQDANNLSAGASNDYDEAGDEASTLSRNEGLTQETGMSPDFARHPFRSSSRRKKQRARSMF
jgi:peptide/histidine transporter 3/4